MELRMQIVTEGKRFSKIVILPENTYDDEAIQGQEVLEAFRELRSATLAESNGGTDNP
ncbi:hypothetical protein [Streptomyces sp. NPDC006477]|uniref:hypothetical protein n=1 Tax=Streptomyces sp. NPDC006477 TaxID=3364747 RepID=UPI00369194C4